MYKKTKSFSQRHWPQGFFLLLTRVHVVLMQSWLGSALRQARVRVLSWSLTFIGSGVRGEIPISPSVSVSTSVKWILISWTRLRLPWRDACKGLSTWHSAQSSSHEQSLGTCSVMPHTVAWFCDLSLFISAACVKGPCHMLFVLYTPFLGHIPLSSTFLPSPRQAQVSDTELVLTASL